MSNLCCAQWRDKHELLMWQGNALALCCRKNHHCLAVMNSTMQIPRSEERLRGISPDHLCNIEVWNLKHGEHPSLSVEKHRNIKCCAEHKLSTHARLILDVGSWLNTWSSKRGALQSVWTTNHRHRRTCQETYEHIQTMLIVPSCKTPIMLTRPAAGC